MKAVGLIAAITWAAGLAVAPVPLARAAAKPTDPAPKLVVLLSVDQMRADYIQQYGRAWKHGLRRLLKQGAVFEQARYPYLNTVTCAGHMTIGTGAFPHRHGMVLNGWWSRELKRGFECTEDAGAPTITYGQEKNDKTSSQPPLGHSAKNLQVPTLVDAMVDAAKAKGGNTSRPRIASFSSKARSAIGLVGNHADLVTWFDGRQYATSRQFADKPSPVVQRVLASHPVDDLVKKPWTKIGPRSAYRYADDAPVEQPPISFWTKVFPHPLRIPAAPAAVTAGKPATPLAPLAAWDRSALSDQMLLAFAKAAVNELELGRGRRTDVLAISFSALDSVGHAFGPRSHEIQDVLLRLDRLLADLLTTLDRKVGKGKYVVALTADHGVATYPEQLTAEGSDAGRVPMKLVDQRLNAAIEAELGPGKHVSNVRYTDLYLAPGVLDRLRAKAGAVDRVKAAVRTVPGVAVVFSTDQLRDPGSATDPLQKAAALSHFPARSGDLILVPRPNWLTTAEGTTHGTNNDYDQRVPVVLFGAGIRPGRYQGAASPADIAPSLAHLVGVPLPTAEGRALREAFSRARPARNTLAASGR